MGHFAHLDENDIVTNIIIADIETIQSGRFGDAKFCVETDKHTTYGVHYGENGIADGGKPLRGNYAVIGGKYDRTHDVFYPVKPFPSWIINAPDWQWKAPVPKPPRSDVYINKWNESTRTWDKIKR